MIAKVVVDVPNIETDRAFDYKIPTSLLEVVEKGIRVLVPFGPRKVPGIVVDITEKSPHSVRPIEAVLDVEPVLTEELVDLGSWLADTMLSFKISAYQVMIPVALRATMKRELFLLAEVDKLPPTLQPFFSNSNRVNLADVMRHDKKMMQIVNEARKEKLIEINDYVEERGRKRKERFIRLATTHPPIDDIPKRANKQLELITFLQKQTEPVHVQTVLQQLNMTRGVIQTLIEKGYVIQFEQEIYRDPLAHVEVEQTKPLPLTVAQSEVLQSITDAMDKGEHKTFLLHGVTGSGKTEVYLQAIAHTLAKGKEAIVLVPEISLTPQMVKQFKGRFGEKVAVLHSGLSMGEKYDEWRKIRRKEVQVVVGARSAIFAPFTNIGIIIMDEEHETSYKQEDHPRYHARDVAIYRAKTHRVPVVLGSATPSLESYARAKRNVYSLLSLSTRIQDRAMPTVKTIDMRNELRRGNRSMFSTILYEKLQDRIEKQEQTVLFLNRRGYSTFVMCRDCGYVAACDHCDISLTYHRSSHSLKCHYCGYEQQAPNICDSCASEHIRFFGTGTQKVEAELKKIIPKAKVIRMDVDTTRRKGAHERLLSSFGRGEADILLGTQMIAKGLDFPKVTLVGVLAADSMLHLPDFRSAERTFQLLEQVSGRAGRHQLEGEVIIQSYTPDHYSINLVKTHDYESFFQIEMAHRRRGAYPPYVFIVLITVSHPTMAEAMSITTKIVQYIKNTLSESTNILGPVAAPLARIKDRYRYQCMIKYKDEPKLRETLRHIQNHYSLEINKGTLHLSIDLQPYLFS